MQIQILNFTDQIHIGRRKKNYFRPVVFILFLAALLCMAGSALAVDISDSPMDNKVQAAPPNLMFVYDNSGSMDWEFMTEESNGLFDSDYYVFRDEDYSNLDEHTYGGDDDPSDTSRSRWHSQWIGYNKIYYDPTVDYLPWPDTATYTFTDADTTNPRANPISSGTTFNLAGDYLTIAEYSYYTDGVIIDNSDYGSSAFVITDDFGSDPTTSTGWQPYTSSSGLNDNYLWTNDAGDYTATWTTDLSAGDYAVFVRWVNNSSRSTAVPYTVHHSSGTSAYNVNQQDSSRDDYYPTDSSNEYRYYAQLGGAGTTFSFSGSSSVSITYTSSGSSDRICADAVAFARPVTVSAVTIKNAHYYTWVDADADEAVDSGEIYLVTFADDDSDGVLDVDTTGTTDNRKYYQVVNAYTDEDSEIEAGNLIAVTSQTTINAIRPKIYDEDGIFVEYKTDAQDLQNFANWFSYFRKRELTAKSAVANAINSIDRMYVGLYTINSGVREEVVPVKVDMPDTIIMGTDHSGYEEGYIDRDDGTRYSGGSWSNSSSSNQYSQARYTTRGETSSEDENFAVWTPDIPSDGTYNVFAWWNCYSNRDSNAMFTITYDNGGTPATDIVYKDERLGGADGCGQWVLLGQYDFTAGTSGSVEVRRHLGSDGGSTVADAVKFESTTSTSNVDNTNTLLDYVYAIDSDNSTPLRRALEDIGQYYHADDSNTGNLGNSPFAAAVDGGECQQAFAIVMTDGYWNGSDPAVGNADGDDGSPYADNVSNTLGDVAMYYYENDLSSALDDLVPTDLCDTANYQHMVTYTLSFGVKGNLTPYDADGDGEEDDPCFLNSATPAPAWPDPMPSTEGAERIDDLWHAAVNGRGLFFSAADSSELAESMRAILIDIGDMPSGASVSVNGEELNSGTVLYQSRYQSSGWIGTVLAYNVDQYTGEIETNTPLWDGADQLQTITWDTRKIVSYNGTDAGVSFLYDSLTTAQKTALDAAWATDDTNARNMVDYLRGREVSGFRPRTQKLGDIVHSAPLLQGSTIFVGGNDGMLHAFNAETGTERFAYVPNLVFSNLNLLTDFNYDHMFYVDLTPFAKSGVDIGGSAKTVLVGGLGKGGQGYYALDITNADSASSYTETQIATQVMWEYPRAGTTDADMGYSFSKAFVVKSNSSTDEWVVVFGNGYNSSSGKSVLYILDMDGVLIRKIDTLSAGGNGLSTPAMIDVDNDRKVDYVYAGDLNGNLWKFDLTSEDSADWDVAFESGGVPQPLFDTGGQPITAKPDVMYHCDKDGYMVVFGTGKFLGDADRINVDQQSIYGIWDYGDDDDDEEYVGTLDHATGAVSSPGSATMLEQTIVDSRTIDGAYYRTFSDNEADWETSSVVGASCGDGDGLSPCDPNDTPVTGAKPDPVKNVGWYFDFPNTGYYAGERVFKDVMIRDGRAFVISFTPNTSPCSGGGDSFLYILDACDGSRLDVAQFDIDDADDLIQIGTDAEGNPIMAAPTGKGFTGILHAPKVVRKNDGTERLYMSASTGVIETEDVPEEFRGVTYWRECQ